MATMSPLEVVVPSELVHRTGEARLLVTGSRDWTDYQILKQVLDWIDPSIIGHGQCRGADALAEEWALAAAVPTEPYPADWYPQGAFDRGAGPRRNRVMLREFRPDLVVAFKDPFDFSLREGGTEDMVRIALRVNLLVLHVDARGVVTPLPRNQQFWI